MIKTLLTLLTILLSAPVYAEVPLSKEFTKIADTHLEQLVENNYTTYLFPRFRLLLLNRYERIISKNPGGAHNIRFNAPDSIDKLDPHQIPFFGNDPEFERGLEYRDYLPLHMLKSTTKADWHINMELAVPKSDWNNIEEQLDYPSVIAFLPGVKGKHCAVSYPKKIFSEVPTLSVDQSHLFLKDMKNFGEYDYKAPKGKVPVLASASLRGIKMGCFKIPDSEEIIFFNVIAERFNDVKKTPPRNRAKRPTDAQYWRNLLQQEYQKEVEKVGPNALDPEHPDYIEPPNPNLSLDPPDDYVPVDRSKDEEYWKKVMENNKIE